MGDTAPPLCVVSASMNARISWAARCALACLAASACSPVEAPAETSAAEARLGSTNVLEIYVVLDGPSATQAVGSAASSGSPDAVRRTRTRLGELAKQRDAVRPALLANGATIVAELSRLANAFQIRVPRDALPRIRAIPEVVSVEPVPLYERALHSALPVVGAPGAWMRASPLHGEGVSVGILDTGVDYLHADFGGSGDPAAFESDDPTIVEPGTFPTARVVGGFDFAGDDYNPSADATTPVPDDDPIDCDGHGSHVAGIAAGGGVLVDGESFAGPYDQSFDFGQFRVAPGVAPLANLYALKIFGCDGSTRLVASGLEWAADPDGNGDFSDRIDVVNASLGSSYGFPSPTNEQMLASYHDLGGLFVAAAGNEGSTFFVTGSPGNFSQSLSVAASIDTTFIALEITAPPGLAGAYAASEASFTAPLAGAPVSGDLAWVEPHFACEPLENAAAVAGKIALIDRGDCSFYDKVSNAAAAGAVGAVVVNNTFDAPFTMSTSDTGGTVDIPAVMIRLVDGELFKEALPSGVTVTLGRDPFVGPGSEVVAGLSSRGPSTVDGQLKPEIAAPGVAIDSANVGSGVDATSKQGTSMATPFVAGAAALVRQARPALTPSEVKAVLINSATPLFNGDGEPYPVSMQGSGRVDIVRAIEQELTAAQGGAEGIVAVTFEPIATTSPTATARTLTVKNHGTEAVTLASSAQQIHALPGVTVTVAPSELTLAAGSSAELTATLAVDPTALGDPALDPVTSPTQSGLPRHFLDEADGHIVLSDEAGAPVLVLPFYGVVRAASALAAAPARGCALETGEVVAVPLDGDSAHPSPTISAFELGVVDGSNITTPDKELDIRAVGVATDAPIEARFEESSVHFGVAVEGEWTTPARGAYSLVGIAIDSDRDGTIDYALRVEPMNAEEPFYDVLATTVYDSSGQTGKKRYVNLGPANVADTQPFYSSVIVLSAFSHDIGLDDENTAFDYFAFSEGFLGTVEQTAVATFDVMAPRVDPARAAPEPGLPLYGADTPILAHLGARDENGFLPDLLLFHHNGARGARFEIVNVTSYAADTLTLGHTFPAAVTTSRPAGKIEIRNDGDVIVHDVTVSGTLLGGSPAVLAPSHGTCDDGPSVRCSLGSIPPGATRSITVQLAMAEGASSVDMDLVLRSAAGCELPLAIALARSDGREQPPSLDVGGGCGCRVAPSAPGRAGWLLAGLWLVGRRRLRRR